MITTNIILKSMEITNKEDLRELFDVDAQFINRDNQFYESHNTADSVPFDAVIKEHGWQEDLDKTVRILGQELLEFDEDFQYFDYAILNLNGQMVVSVVFGILEY